MPDMKANKMEAYCEKLIIALQDDETRDREIGHAAKIVEKASSGNFHRDNIRTDPFTESVMKLAHVGTANGAKAGTKVATKVGAGS